MEFELFMLKSFHRFKILLAPKLNFLLADLHKLNIYDFKGEYLKF